jgi:hypothetical protein
MGMNSIRNLIADDSFAMSFQSMGQYRTALLKALDVTPPAPEAGEVEELVAWMRGQVAIAPAAQTQWAKRFLRIATLLQQLSAPAPAPKPIPVSERLPGVGEVGELAAWLENHAAHLRKMQEIGAWPETELQEMLDRAATLLQQQESRVAFLRYVLIDCGQAVGGLVNQSCSDSFLLDVATEVRLAIAKPAPAVVPVAVSERLPGPEDCDEDGFCWMGYGYRLPGENEKDQYAIWMLMPFEESNGEVWVRASDIPLPQAGEVEG